MLRWGRALYRPRLGCEIRVLAATELVGSSSRHFNSKEVLISHKKPFSFWTSYFMFWRRQPCKCLARRQSSHTRIVSPAGDRLILRRWWLTRAHVSGCTALWCRKRGEETEAEYGGGGGGCEGDDERKRREKTGRNKHEETGREPRRKWGRPIPRNHVLVMCGENARREESSSRVLTLSTATLGGETLRGSRCCKNGSKFLLCSKKRSLFLLRY